MSIDGTDHEAIEGSNVLDEDDKRQAEDLKIPIDNPLDIYHALLLYKHGPQKWFFE